MRRTDPTIRPGDGDGVGERSGTVNDTGRRWRRYLAEGTVIVVGILVALAADAIWEYRVDRGDEATALRQLHAEFAANAAQLDTVAAEHRRGIEAVTVLLGAVRGSTMLTPDSVRTLVAFLDAPWTFNPKLAALESVVASGQLRLIRDDSLRVELIGWPGIVEDMREDELFAAQFTYAAQYDLVSGIVNWGDIYGPAEGRQYRPLSIVGEEGLESVLAYRYSWFASILAELTLVEAALARIRALLDENLTDD